jgi:hypothetical protein
MFSWTSRHGHLVCKAGRLEFIIRKTKASGINNYRYHVQARQTFEGVDIFIGKFDSLVDAKIRVENILKEV